jgi:hypothetical protein
MALPPPELLRAHLNLDRETLAALRNGKPVIVASRQQCPTRKPLPEWPDRTVAVLSTENEEVHAIPITAPLRVGDRRILFRLKRCRESLARLREHPKVALTIFGKGNLAFTARGPAHVVQESMVVAPAFAAVAIDVENIDDHRQREFAVDSGVSLDWTNERTEQFLQEHFNTLREVAARGNSACPRCALRSKHTKRHFTFSEMSIFERLRNKWNEHALPNLDLNRAGGRCLFRFQSVFGSLGPRRLWPWHI